VLHGYSLVSKIVRLVYNQALTLSDSDHESVESYLIDVDLDRENNGSGYRIPSDRQLSSNFDFSV